MHHHFAIEVDMKGHSNGIRRNGRKFSRRSCAAARPRAAIMLAAASAAGSTRITMIAVFMACVCAAMRLAVIILMLALFVVTPMLINRTVMPAAVIRAVISRAT